MRKEILIIVPGVLNADIMGLGVSEIVGKGQYSTGGELRIGPGGKSRNIAEMISNLIGKNKVAMISRTVKDPVGLWKYPVDALLRSGVNTDYLSFEKFNVKKKFPGIALIPIDKAGNNQIYFLPGITEDFVPSDILAASSLFKKASNKSGLLAQTLELPFKTALAAIMLANKYRLRVILDPGGTDKKSNFNQLWRYKIFLCKPNEHEAEILTGVKVTDFKSAQKAADSLMKKGVENVLITHGAHGAYLFTKSAAKHIKIPKLKSESKVQDETGAGDQTMATLCAELMSGADLELAARTAVIAGTMQFNKPGVQPITKSELSSQLAKISGSD